MKHLTIKDIILTGAFAALYFLTVGLGTLAGALFDRSGNMMYAPAFAAVLGGVVYFLLIDRVGKFGAVTLLGIVMGGFFFLSGHFFASALPGILFGLVADFVARQGGYRSKGWNFLSFVLFSFVNAGPILLMWVARSSYIDSLLARGKDMAYVNRVLLPLDAPVILWFLATVVVGALVGGFFGHYLVQKHFQRDRK